MSHAVIDLRSDTVTQPTPAMREAMAQAGLEKGDAALHRATVITGSCVGGQSTEDAGFTDLYLKGRPRVNPLTIPKTMANAGASRISLEYGVHGAVYTISTACSSSNHAIGQAFWAVRSGATEVAITGGSEAMFSMGILKAWEAMRVVSPDTCRPFSKNRKGLILGEAGAMLVLETLERARARGARILGEIVGFAMSSDAHHLTQPSVEGPVMALEQALAERTAPGHFLAHLGGDDFFALVRPAEAPAVAERAIELFDAARATHYDPDDRARGAVVTRARSGQLIPTPLVTLTVAEANRVPKPAVTWVVPSPTPNTTPVESTVATAAF